MKMMNKYTEIETYLDILIKNPVCELNYFNDYSLLISIMLSAQTTDKRVNIVTKELFSKYKDLNALKNANLNDIERIIKSLGSYHKKALNIIDIATKIIDENEGIVPVNRKVLLTYPGVGRKTINVFLSEYYHIPNIAVDTHVERVVKRLNLCKSTSNVITIEKTLKRNVNKSNWSKFHLQLVLFGRYYCKAKNPLCLECKLKNICNYQKM